MKEVTYEDWQKNPTPRKMWVWDYDEERKKQEKVVHYINANVSCPVVIETVFQHIVQFRHCAEIEEPKARRMTNKELSRWLRPTTTREFKYKNSISTTISCYYVYLESEASKEVSDEILIREDDGEWREPLVEVEE